MKRFEMTEEQYEAHQRKWGKDSRRKVDPGGLPESQASPALRQARPEYYDYKADFLKQIGCLGLPMPTHGAECEQKELQFARPRLWRFDWAYEGAMIAIEYQGGNYTGKGRHNSIKGLR